MKKAIVTTTINEPTEAIKRFVDIARADGWQLVIVGDKKTPHEAYRDLARVYGHVSYIDPDMQEQCSLNLSDLIGWNCIQRRNFGFIAAYRWGAEIIATVDDDNIPKKDWGRNVVVGMNGLDVDVYQYKKDVGPEYIAFDPLAPTIHGSNMWHRGFPIQLLKQRNRLDVLSGTCSPLVQADLWDGAPDIDAVCRISKSNDVKFDQKGFYTSVLPMPFNSQNTFLFRPVIPHYFMWPHIGRMDDIWAAYYVQKQFPGTVVFGPASVVQKRNEHDIVKDLEDEMLGYKHTLDWIKYTSGPAGTEMPEVLPDQSLDAFREYRKCLIG